MSERSPPYDVQFNFVRFMKFLQDNDIGATAVAAVLSDRINEVTNEFFDGIILPIVNKDADKDGVRDIKRIEDIELKVLNVKFKIGKLGVSVLKFIIVTYIVFIITRLINRVSRS